MTTFLLLVTAGLFLGQSPAGSSTVPAAREKVGATKPGQDVKASPNPDPGDAAKVAEKEKLRLNVGANSAYDAVSWASREAAAAALLKWPEVRAEIGLSFAEYQTLMKALSEARLNIDQEINRLPINRDDYIRMAPVVLATKHNTDYRVMRKLIKPEQFRRLREIALQVKGYRALCELEYQDFFHLSPALREQIAEVNTEFFSLVNPLDNDATKRITEFVYADPKNSRQSPEDIAEFRSANYDYFDSIAKRKQEYRELAAKKIERLLTKRQREAFRKAQGKPFDLKAMAMPGSEGQARRDVERLEKEAESAKKK